MRAEWMLCTQVFLEGVKAALTADAKFNGGEYAPNDPPIIGIKACARVYAGRTLRPCMPLQCSDGAQATKLSDAISS